MKGIAGSILVLTAAVLLGSNSLLEAAESTRPPSAVGWLSIFLSASTGLLGVIYLLVDNAKSESTLKFYQMTIKTLLLVITVVAALLAGRAWGLKTLEQPGLSRGASYFNREWEKKALQIERDFGFGNDAHAK